MSDVSDLTAPARAATEPPDLAARRPGRAMTITLVVSLGLHVAAVIAALLLLHAVPVVDAPDKPTEVELVMEEHAGNVHPAASPAAQPTSAPPPEKPVKVEKPDPSAKQAPPDKTVETTAAETPPDQSPPASPPVEARQDTPTQTSEPAKTSDPAPAAAPSAQEAEAPPAPPATQTAPTITLSGTDSPSDARAWGDRIIPAAPDAVFHNRPPEYPQEAAMNGEHGTVILVIHISPAGTASGVDVTRSSGYVLLDRAAREAVSRWRFLPAVKDGQPVASDMTMGFVFDY